jgi:3-oxoisoapionate decarboxylase
MQKHRGHIRARRQTQGASAVEYRSETAHAPDRRVFLKTLGTAAVAAGAPGLAGAASVPVRFGVDMFSVGAQKWTPFEQLDFAATWKVKVVQFSEIRQLGGLEPDLLRRVRARADELGLDVEVGMRSICPTSTTFDKEAGPAEEQLARMVDAARIMRSPIVRAFLGSSADRRGGIDRHIEETVRVLKATRSRVMDAGVMVAVENHAGDMQARELKMLVEAAGPDYVGVTFDPGNSAWTIEDPHLTLDVLAPYIQTSHFRDSAIWRTAEGAAAVRWTRMGEGTIGMDRLIRTYLERCPGKALNVEVIVTPQPRTFAYGDPGFWELYRSTPAWEFSRFMALCDSGRPVPDPLADSGLSPVERNRANVEESIRWTQAFLASL